MAVALTPQQEFSIKWIKIVCSVLIVVFLMSLGYKPSGFRPNQYPSNEQLKQQAFMDKYAPLLDHILSKCSTVPPFTYEMEVTSPTTIYWFQIECQGPKIYLIDKEPNTKDFSLRCTDEHNDFYYLDDQMEPFHVRCDPPRMEYVINEQTITTPHYMKELRRDK